MPQLTLKETITRKIDISTDTLYKIIEQLSEQERKSILIKLKSKPTSLKTFKKDKVQSIIADFAELNIYENDFLKDLEEGLKKTSLYRGEYPGHPLHLQIQPNISMVLSCF